MSDGREVISSRFGSVVTELSRLTSDPIYAEDRRGGILILRAVAAQRLCHVVIIGGRPRLE
jgi:hypothetical protein